MALMLQADAVRGAADAAAGHNSRNGSGGGRRNTEIAGSSADSDGGVGIAAVTDSLGGNAAVAVVAGVAGIDVADGGDMSARGVPEIEPAWQAANTLAQLNHHSVFPNTPRRSRMVLHRVSGLCLRSNSRRRNPTAAMPRIAPPPPHWINSDCATDVAWGCGVAAAVARCAALR